jgi:hypothetical protein
MADFDFFAVLQTTEGGVAPKKAAGKPAFDNPVEQARWTFIEQGKKQIDSLSDLDSDEVPRNKAGQPYGNWFQRQDDGRIRVTFKSGIRMLPLQADKDHYYVKTAEDAVKLIGQAILAADRGDLDKFFELILSKSKAIKAAKVDKVVKDLKTELGMGRLSAH